jgi:hypothetical protein
MVGALCHTFVVISTPKRYRSQTSEPATEVLVVPGRDAEHGR